MSATVEPASIRFGEGDREDIAYSLVNGISPTLFNELRRACTKPNQAGNTRTQLTKAIPRDAAAFPTLGNPAAISAPLGSNSKGYASAASTPALVPAPAPTPAPTLASAPPPALAPAPAPIPSSQAFDAQVPANWSSIEDEPTPAPAPVASTEGEWVVRDFKQKKRPRKATPVETPTAAQAEPVLDSDVTI
jgi:hypothetical protein